MNVVSDHNLARATQAIPSAINMVTMEWDPILAETAYNYMVRTKCTPSNFSHNSNRSSDYWNLGGRNGGNSANNVYVGENWYSNYPDNSTDNVLFGGAVKMWTNGGCRGGSSSYSVWTCTQVVCSEADYFYNNTVNGAPCSPKGAQFESVGHFTQVMWATTQWVGCAYTSSCGTLCDYVMGGNINLPSVLVPSDASMVWQSQ